MMLSVPHRSLMFLSFHGNRAKEMYCKGTGQHLYGRCGLYSLCAYKCVCLHSSAHDAMYVAVNYCEAPRCALCWGGMLHSKSLGIRNITQPRVKYMPLPWQTTVSTDLKKCQQTGAQKTAVKMDFPQAFSPSVSTHHALPSFLMCLTTESISLSERVNPVKFSISCASHTRFKISSKTVREGEIVKVELMCIPASWKWLPQWF